MPLYCSHGDEIGECRFHVFERDFRWGQHKPAYCIHHKIEVECTQCQKDAAWAIIKNSKDLRSTHHDRAIDWARGFLHLDASASREPQDEDASWSAVNMDTD